MKNQASIFNDVIGPIMRGPSSSHTAASWRVVYMALQMLNDVLETAHIEYDPDGQWASNYVEQGSVLGMNGGLLGINMADDQMKRTEEIAAERGVEITYGVNPFENAHPNSMLLRLKGRSGKSLQVLAASLGGGTFEIQGIDGFKVQRKGDYYELYAWSKKDISDELQQLLPGGSCLSA